MNDSNFHARKMVLVSVSPQYLFLFCESFRYVPSRVNHEQVEVDTPNGESLAFMLRHGDEEGTAIVVFCRDNQADFPDEQACVIALMQELHS